MMRFALCIGAAKAGTTWLYEQMARNDAIYTTPEKELHFFHSVYSGMDRLTPERRKQRVAALLRERTGKIAATSTLADASAGLRQLQDEVRWHQRFLQPQINADWYLGLFAGAKANQICMDFSPSTSLISDEGVAAINRVCGDAKLIYILRDPISRLWSHVKFNAQYNKNFDEVMRFDFGSLRKYIKQHGLTQQSLYGANLEKFLKVFKPKNILLLDYAKIATRPTDLQAQLETFLSVPFDQSLDSSARVNASPSIGPTEEFMRFYHEFFRPDVVKLGRLGCDFSDEWIKRWEQRAA